MMNLYDGGMVARVVEEMRRARDNKEYYDECQHMFKGRYSEKTSVWDFVNINSIWPLTQIKTYIKQRYILGKRIGKVWHYQSRKFIRNASKMRMLSALKQNIYR